MSDRVYCSCNVTWSTDPPLLTLRAECLVHGDNKVIKVRCCCPGDAIHEQCPEHGPISYVKVGHR